MSRMTIDLNSLAQETLELSENIRAQLGQQLIDAHQGEFTFDGDFEERGEEGFEDTFDFSDPIKEDAHEGSQEEAEIEVEGVGLLYKLEKGISTFCIRAVVSEDLAWDKESLERGDVELERSLKIKEEEDLEHVGFFKCEDLAIAETIFDQLINRRFPRQEAMLCNLSDPGFSWWLDLSENALRIYFQSHGIERDDSLIQLGPLGDPMIAARRLSRSLSFMKNIFPVNEFSATDKAFMVSCTSSGLDAFKGFKDLILKGEDTLLKNQQLVSIDPTFSLYLRELAGLRRFWIQATADCL